LFSGKNQCPNNSGRINRGRLGKVPRAGYEAKRGLRNGGSNSVSYAGHILTKKELAGCIKRKNVSAGHNRRLKVPLYYKKQ